MEIRTLSRRWQARLFAPVDIASLAVFRIAFGGILLWQILYYFGGDLISVLWIKPQFHFTYPGFHWVKPWPGIGMYLHMGALGILACLITVGLFYRTSVALFFLGFTYTFLLEHALYLNHYYFVCLVTFLMIFVPAHRAFSLDVWRHPERATSVIPYWPLWLLRAQLAVVYVYAGIAKLNWDWLHGEPLRQWLQKKGSTPIVGTIFEHAETFYLLSWAGVAFDLLIVPLLVWKKTRTAAFVVAVCFHLLNAWFFKIGIFPWLSIVVTTLFFEPDWPRRFLSWFRVGPSHAKRIAPVTAGILRLSKPQRRRTLALISLYMAFQLLFPLRHWVYPGDVAWTEEGHEFSWRMKLRQKTGQVVFDVTDLASKETWLDGAEGYLESWQVEEMTGRPELIRQFAHYLAGLVEKEIHSPVEVRVHSGVKLNNRTCKPIIDPSIDLSKEPYQIAPAKWITHAPPSPRPWQR